MAGRDPHNGIRHRSRTWRLGAELVTEPSGTARMILKRYSMSALAYPAKFSAASDGRVLAEFIDLPRVATDGKDKREAMEEAIDALGSDLSIRLSRHEDIPSPSAPKGGQRLIPLCSLRNWRQGRGGDGRSGNATQWHRLLRNLHNAPIIGSWTRSHVRLDFEISGLSTARPAFHGTLGA